MNNHETTRGDASILGPEAQFKGEITSTGPVRILGVFEGTIRGTADLTVGPAGRCTANIDADVARIDGVVMGDIVARERLTLGPRAKIEGDVRAAALAVEVGATIAGRVLVGPEAVAAARPAGEAELKPLPRVTVRAIGRAPAEFMPEVRVEAAPAGDWLAAAGVTTAKPAWLDGGDAGL